MAKILIIPDAHASPGYDNVRFAALGNFILKEFPDRIVCLGDWYDMPSLSSYDKGTKGFEGRRYSEDIRAGNRALEYLHGPMDDYNASRARNKKAKYTPALDFVTGNHEDRISRAINAQPNLDGALSLEDLDFARRGWNVHPFKRVVDVEGFAVSHYFASGVMGRPIGGTNGARALITKLHCSAIVGHSHLRDFADDTRPNGDKVLGIVGGCYTHPGDVAGWSAGTAHLWWRGVVVLDDAHQGYARDVRFVDQSKIVRDFI